MRELAGITLAHRQAGSCGTGRRPDLDTDRAELLARSALAALSSVSFHLPQPQFKDVLADFMVRITEASLPDDLDRDDTVARRPA